MTPKAHNGLVHYTLGGREVAHTPLQAWQQWFTLQHSADPENKAMAIKLKVAMDEAEEQSKVTA